MRRPRPHVAVDVRWAQGSSIGGVGRGLLHLLPRVADRVDVLALADPRRGAFDVDVSTRWLKLPFSAPSMIWLEACVPSALRKFDGIFHSPFNFLPRVNVCPTVVTIHDVSFVTHRHLFREPKGAVFRMKARGAVKRATQVLTVSEWSREQILDAYDVAPDRVHVVANGVDRSFRPLNADDESKLEALLTVLCVRRPYMVTVGGAARRGSDISVNAWRMLRRKGLPHDLIVLWEPGNSEPGLTRVPVHDEKQYRLLLAGADLLLYPTETESFGMPALEAAACGTPPLCPPTGALPEVLGEAAVWCERDAVALASKAEEMLRSPDELARFVALGAQVAARWTWDLAADALVGVYEQGVRQGWTLTC